MKYDASMEIAACYGKTKYDRHDEAARAITPKARKLGVEVYRCPFCHGFHVGRPSLRNRRTDLCQ